MADKFVFHSRSKNAKPGSGSGEKVSNPKNYTELQKIKDWRKALSNLHIAPFRLDDNEWNSVEHFFHAVKFRYDKSQRAKTPQELAKVKKNYAFYQTFTLDSGSPWSEDPKLAKRAGKTGRKSIITGIRYRDKTLKLPTDTEIEMREDFYTPNVVGRLQKVAFLAKFTQHEDLKLLLLATGDAELWHYTGKRGKSKDHPGEILFDELMIVRDCIRKFDQKCNLAEVSQFSSDFITKILA
uniref:NADAR domain-containing protein n=1 Tax=viral metagenome TaxID=1070528 RepID=A0A6C0H2S8_9ZZZZ